MSAPITQKELTAYAKAMRAAGVPVWRVVIDKPDGTQVRLYAGDDDIALERKNDWD